MIFFLIFNARRKIERHTYTSTHMYLLSPSTFFLPYWPKTSISLGSLEEERKIDLFETIQKKEKLPNF